MKDEDLSNVSRGVMGIFWGHNEYLLIILTREITGFFGGTLIFGATQMCRGEVI